MALLTEFVRGRTGPAILSPWDLNQLARGIVDAIDSETGNRKAHNERVARLYAVLRDVQTAAEQEARDVTVHKMIEALAQVWANAFYVGVYRRVWGPR
jgi:hypothetical protein